MPISEILSMPDETDYSNPLVNGSTQMGMPLDLLWLTVPGYVILQVVALMRSSGGSRLAALDAVHVPRCAGVRCRGRSLSPTVGSVNRSLGPFEKLGVVRK